MSLSESKWDQVSSSEIHWIQVRSSESKWVQVRPSEIKWDPPLPILLSNFSWRFRCWNIYIYIYTYVYYYIIRRPHLTLRPNLILDCLLPIADCLMPCGLITKAAQLLAMCFVHLTNTGVAQMENGEFNTAKTSFEDARVTKYQDSRVDPIAIRRSGIVNSWIYYV